MLKIGIIFITQIVELMALYGILVGQEYPEDVVGPFVFYLASLIALIALLKTARIYKKIIAILSIVQILVLYFWLYTVFTRGHLYFDRNWSHFLAYQYPSMILFLVIDIILLCATLVLLYKNHIKYILMFVVALIIGMVLLLSPRKVTKEGYIYKTMHNIDFTDQLAPYSCDKITCNPDRVYIDFLFGEKYNYIYENLNNGQVMKIKFEGRYSPVSLPKYLHSIEPKIVMENLISSEILGKKEKCEAVTAKELNNYYSSEHSIRTEIFWSEKYNNCFVVTRRPFLTPASDWAIEYFGEPNRKDPYFMEAEAFSLGIYPERNIPAYLEKTYSYENLNEYLADPQKYKVWEADFLKQVEHFR